MHVAKILMAAPVMGEVAARFGTPSVIGEIVAGIILGPSVLSLIEAEGLIWVLAEIGIILLLFQIGSKPISVNSSNLEPSRLSLQSQDSRYRL